VTLPSIEVLSVAEARDKIGTIAHRAGLRHEVTVLTYRGQATAAVVPLDITAEQLEQLREHVRSTT
jgi:hypothetical protein